MVKFGAIGCGLSLALAMNATAAPITLFSDDFNTDTALGDPAIQAGDVGDGWTVDNVPATYVRILAGADQYLNLLARNNGLATNNYGTAFGQLSQAALTQNATVTFDMDLMLRLPPPPNDEGEYAGTVTIAGSTGTASTDGIGTDPRSFDLRIDVPTGVISAATLVNGNEVLVSTGLIMGNGTLPTASLQIVADYATQTYSVTLTGGGATDGTATGLAFRDDVDAVSSLLLGNQARPTDPLRTHQVNFDNIQVVVPEPASLALMALGGAMMLGRRRSA